MDVQAQSNRDSKKPDSAGATKRVAVVASHPIQHFTPLYRRLARQPELELKVFFCSKIGLKSYFDPGFGIEFAWEANLLEGYQSEFLENAEDVKSTDFWDVRAPDLFARLEEFKPDVVQVYGYAQVAALQAISWCTVRKVPVILMSDSELVHERPLHVRTVKKLLLPPLYRLVSGFLTIGDNNEAYMRHYGVPQRKLFRSPYPTNDDLFLATLSKTDEVRQQTRAKLGISPSAFVAVFVGKLIDRKRPADLLSAVSLAAQRSGREMVALFVGDGALRASLEQQARANPACANFAGFINQNELPSMYAAADVVAHPADMDPHPIAVTEGVLMGLPAVVSDRIGSSGPTDTVRVGQNGFVCPVGNVEAFASALQQLAGDDGLRRSMAAASRRIADEMGIETSVRGYLQAVRTVTA